MDGNPITKPYCKDCKFWDPIGFYTWEREEDFSKRKCKHLKKCNRIYDLVIKQEIQMDLSNYLPKQRN
jgi:predicted phosphoadenosine phosphosulfate sulfurtransferase